jgi:hypothetical protein
MAPLPPLVQPPGFILGGEGNPEPGPIYPIIELAVATVGLLAKGFQSINEFRENLFGPNTNNTGIVKPPTEEFLIGSSVINANDTGGQWTRLSTVTTFQKWNVILEIKEDNRTSTLAKQTTLDTTYTIAGPFRVPFTPSTGSNITWPVFYVEFYGIGPNGNVDTYRMQTDANIGAYFSFPFQPALNVSIKARFQVSGSNVDIEPVPLRDQRKFPVIPLITPDNKPLIVPNAPTLPEPELVPPPIPKLPPPTQPLTPEPQRQPKPQPLPLVPFPIPSTTPKPSNPTNTQPQGGLVPAPKSAPAVTPTTAHFIGNKKVTANGPQPTMTGISQELGRLEFKLTTAIKNNDDIIDDLFNLLQRTQTLKNLIDSLFDSEAQKFFTITSPCETDAEGNRIEFKSTIAASNDRIGAVINRLNAIADLLQHTKNLKQPACPIQRTPLTGEPVTVNFQQID